MTFQKIFILYFTTSNQICMEYIPRRSSVDVRIKRELKRRFLEDIPWAGDERKIYEEVYRKFGLEFEPTDPFEMYCPGCEGFHKVPYRPEDRYLYPFQLCVDEEDMKENPEMFYRWAALVYKDGNFGLTILCYHRDLGSQIYATKRPED